MKFASTAHAIRFAGGSVMALAAALPAVAHAQDAAAAEADTNGNVIIVTANKRAESIQDISLSIQAFDAEGLEAAGIEDVSRLELVVPGVNFAFSGNDTKFNVRGANSSNTYSDNSSIVGTYVDGIYKARASQQSRAFFDVERVEFLKGPQGTLYGRNTFAGALNLYTKKPELGDYSAGVELGYERFNAFSTEAFVNVPLGDNAALRAAGYVNKSDGYIKNLAGPDIGQQDDRGFRLSAYFEPSDNFDVTLRLQHTEEDGREAGLFGYTTLCRNVTPSGHTDALGSQRDCVVPTSGSLPPGTDPDNFTPTTDLYTANSGQPGTGPYTIAQDYVPDVDLKETVLSLEANLDLGAVQVKSITAYTDFQNLFGFDFDFSPTVHNIGGFDETLESFSQELQFNTDFDGPFNLTSGIYYSKEEAFFSFSIYNPTRRDDSSRVPVPVLDNAGNPVLDGMGDPLLLPILDATPIVSLDRDINGHFADSSFIDTTTFGIYAQGELELSDRLRVIGGLRYSSEKKELAGGGNNFVANGPVTIAPGWEDGEAPTILVDSRNAFVINKNASGSATGSRTFKNWDYKASIEFDAADDVMLYATTATGFLSGAINNDASTTGQQESVVYEVGLKSQLFDRMLTLNAAAYYTEYTNLLAQFQIIDPNTQIGITFSENSGSIEVWGAELDATLRPTDALTLGMTAAYMNSEYGNYGQTSPYQLHGGSTDLFVDLAGETTLFAPEFTGSLFGSYRIDLGDMGSITPSVHFYYSDGFATSNLFTIDPSAYQDSFTKTDLRLVWDSLDEDYSIELFVENIEDEAVLTRTNNNGADDLLQSGYLYPRNYGVRLRARF